jgi:hypothetical protein
MQKKRKGSAKAAIGQQAADVRRGAPGGRRFIGDDTGAAAARAAERERVHRMQVAARAAAARAAEEHEQLRQLAERRPPALERVGAVVLDSVRLATTLAGIPFRIAAALWPRQHRPA